MAEVLFRAKLIREDSSVPWGFRLQGGADYDKPLTLLKVTEESVACKGGLHPGDIVVKLAGRSSDGMTHKDAQEVIIASGNQLEIIVERAEEELVSVVSPTGPGNASLLPSEETNGESPPQISEVLPSTDTETQVIEVKDNPPSAVTVANTSTESPSVPKTPIAQTQATEPEVPSIPTPSKQVNSQKSVTPNVVAQSEVEDKTNVNIPLKSVTESTKATSDAEKVISKPSTSVGDLKDSKPEASKTVSSVENSIDAKRRESPQTVLATASLVSIPVSRSPSGVKEEKLLATADETRTSRNVTRFQGSPSAVGSPTAPWRKPRDTTPSSSSSDSDIDIKPKERKVENNIKKTDNDIRKPAEQKATVEPKKVIQIPVVHTTSKAEEAASQKKDFSKVAPWRTGHSSSASANNQAKPVLAGESQPVSKPVQTSIIQSVSESGSTQVSVPVVSQTAAQTSATASVADPLHPWRKSHPKEEAHSSPPVPDSIHARAQSAPVTSIQPDKKASENENSQTLPTGFSPKDSSAVQEHKTAPSTGPGPATEATSQTISKSSETDPSVQPSLTFIGRRIESPTKDSGSPVNSGVPVGKTPFSHLMQDVRGSPTNHGSPLAKTLLSHHESPTGRGSPKTVSSPSSTVPRVSAVAGAQMSQTLPQPSLPSEGQVENIPKAYTIPVIHQTSPGGDAIPVVSLTVPQPQERTHSPVEEGYHSPRPDDIYFSTASPDLVDIPMPAVKEMVADLNRRLEAIAAQQPRIAQPPTAHELGLSFLKKDQLQALQRSLAEAEERGEIFVGADPTALANLKQRLFGAIGVDPEVAGAFQKIYDVTSPISSPPLHRKKFTYDINRVPSPRSGRRVHFADPPEQSVIEIEPSIASRRRVKRVEEPATEYPSPYELAETLERESQSLSKPLPTRPVPITSSTPFLSPSYPMARSEPQPVGTPMRQETAFLPGGITVTTRPIETHHFLRPTLPVPSRTESRLPSQLGSASVPTRADVSPMIQYLSPVPSDRIPSPSLAQMYSSYLEREQKRASPLSHLERLSPRNVGEHRMMSPQTVPAQAGPGKINVSITHKRTDQGQPTQFNFTIPPGQPGQPSYFRYTLSPKKSAEPTGISYSFPPSYEESMRNRQQRSLDDSRLHHMYAPRPLDPAIYLRTSAGPLSPPIRRGPPSPIYVNTAGGPLSSPSPSPVYMHPRMGILSPPQLIPSRGPPSPIMDTTQGKSFRVLEANMGPGGNQGGVPMPVSVEVPIRPPGQVAQPVAMGRAYAPSPMQGHPGHPTGSAPSPPPGTMVPHQPGPEVPPGMPPGLFALFDKSFTEKFMQWQSQRYRYLQCWAWFAAFSMVFELAWKFLNPGVPEVAVYMSQKHTVWCGKWMTRQNMTSDASPPCDADNINRDPAVISNIGAGCVCPVMLKKV